MECGELEPTISLEDGEVVDDFNGLCIGVGSRILVVQTVDICHEEQQIRVNHGCSDGREGIVVAKLDFRNRKGVVLIDDGNDAHVQQLIECVLGIQIPCTLGAGLH